MFWFAAIAVDVAVFVLTGRDCIGWVSAGIGSVTGYDPVLEVEHYVADLTGESGWIVDEGGGFLQTFSSSSDISDENAQTILDRIDEWGQSIVDGLNGLAEGQLALGDLINSWGQELQILLIVAIVAIVFVVLIVLSNRVSLSVLLRRSKK